MERYEQELQEARKYVTTVDHMLTTTYRHLDDTRIFFPALENLFLAMMKSVTAMLHYERSRKEIPPFHDTFDSKMNAFKMRIVPRHNIDKDWASHIELLRELILSHEASPVTFKRKDVYVICNDGYEMKTISLDQLKEHLKKAKDFYTLMYELTKVQDNG